MQEKKTLFYIPEQDSHIFNHKGGLQIPNNINNNLAQQYITNNGYNAVPQGETYMQNLPETYRIPQWSADTRVQTWPQQQQPPPPPQMPMIVQPIQQQPMQQNALESQIREQQQRQNWPIRPALNASPAIPVMDNHPINNPMKVSKSKVQSGSDTQDSDEETEYDEEEKIAPATEPPPKKKQRKHKDNRTKVNKDKAKKHDEQPHDHEKPMHEQLKMIKSDLDMEFMDHDGPADRPGGAVLSLTLGKYLQLILLYRVN